MKARIKRKGELAGELVEVEQVEIFMNHTSYNLRESHGKLALTMDAPLLGFLAIEPVASNRVNIDTFSFTVE